MVLSDSFLFFFLFFRIRSTRHRIVIRSYFFYCLLSHIPFHLRFGVAFQAHLRSDKIILLLIPSLRWKGTKLKKKKERNEKQKIETETRQWCLTCSRLSIGRRWKGREGSGFRAECTPSSVLRRIWVPL